MQLAWHVSCWLVQLTRQIGLGAGLAAVAAVDACWLLSAWLIVSGAAGLAARIAAAAAVAAVEPPAPAAVDPAVAPIAVVAATLDVSIEPGDETRVLVPPDAAPGTMQVNWHIACWELQAVIQLETVQVVGWKPQFIMAAGEVVPLGAVGTEGEALNVVGMELCASWIFVSAKARSPVPLIAATANRAATPRMTVSTVCKNEWL